MADEILLSVSDIQTFKSCRQKWDFLSGNRQSLRHKATPRLYLSEGSALHEALDAQATGQDYEEVMDGYVEGERARLKAVYEENNGFAAWAIELDTFEESASFVTKLVHQYFDHYGMENPLADQGMTYLATEVPFKLELPVESADGRPVFFVGTWDGVAESEAGNVFLVENKTYSSVPDFAELMFHDQSTGYAVAFYALTGVRMSGMLYNGIAKRLIKEPKLLKNGSLSKDKRQSVTPQSYVAAMMKNDIDVYDEDYTEILNHLEAQAQQDKRFFYREKFYFQDEQLHSWYDELLAVAHEMTNNPRIYRTVPFNGCGKSGADCWVKDLCQTKHSGGDLAWVKERYTTGTYGTLEAMDGATVDYISSVENLKESLRGLRQ